MKYINNGIFFSFKNIDSYNKEFNEIIAPREVGKTTALENGKIYNAIKKGHVVVVYYRNVISLDIDSIEARINRLIENEEEKVFFTYNKFELKSGILRVNASIGKEKAKPVLLCVAIRKKTSDLKKVAASNIAFEVWDEYLVNPRDVMDKYLPDEWNMFMEAHQTFKRFAVDPDKYKTYFIGNAYSRYNPFHVAMNVDTNKLNPGVIIAGNNYAIQVFKMSDELRNLIIKKNKNYDIDKDYANFALGCNYTCDNNINIVKSLPIGYNFKLQYLIYHNNLYLMVFRGFKKCKEYIFIQKINENEFNSLKTKKDTYVFDYKNVNKQCKMLDPKFKKFFYNIKWAMMNNNIFYTHVESYYALIDLAEQNLI